MPYGISTENYENPTLIESFIENPTKKKIKEIANSPNDVIKLIKSINHKLEILNIESKGLESSEIIKKFDNLLDEIGSNNSNNPNEYLTNIFDFLAHNKQERLVTEHPTDCDSLDYIIYKNIESELIMAINAKSDATIKHRLNMLINQIKLVTITDEEVVEELTSNLELYALKTNLDNNDYSAILEDLMQLKQNIITVEPTKRTPAIESTRMLSFLRRDAFHSVNFTNKIIQQALAFSEKKFGKIPFAEEVSIKNANAKRSIVKTGTWAGDSAGKPRVTGETIQASFEENRIAIIDNLIEFITEQPKDIPSELEPVFVVVNNYLTKHPEDNNVKIALEKLGNLIATLNNAKLNNIIIRKKDLGNKVDDIINLLSNDEKYRFLIDSFITLQIYIANNFHVNLYERTDAIVNENAVSNILFEAAKQIPELAKMLNGKVFAEMDNNQQFLFLSELLDLGNENGKNIINHLSEFIKTHNDSLDINAKNEIKRNFVINEGSYLKKIIVDSSGKRYGVWGSRIKSMVADTKTPAHILEKMLLLRICSENPNKQPNCHLIPLTEDTLDFQSAKKSTKQHKNQDGGIIEKLHTCNAFMQYLVNHGLETCKMTARSDTTRAGGRFAASYIGYAADKIADKFSDSQPITECISRNKHYALLDESLLIGDIKVEHREFPSTITIKHYDGQGHNIMRRSGGTPHISTVQGFEHTQLNTILHYILKLTSTIVNIKEKPYDAGKKLFEEHKKSGDIADIARKLSKKLPLDSKIEHQKRHFSGDFEGQSTTDIYRSIIGEAKVNRRNDKPTRDEFNKAARGEKNESGNQKTNTSHLYTQKIIDEITHNFSITTMPTLFAATRAISADLQERHPGTWENLTGHAIFDSIKKTFNVTNIRTINPLLLQLVFTANPELFASLWSFAYGFSFLDPTGFDSLFPKKFKEVAMDKARLKYTISYFESEGYKFAYNNTKTKFVAKINNMTIAIEPTLYDIYIYEKEQFAVKKENKKDLIFMLKTVLGEKFDEQNLLSFMDNYSQEIYQEKIHLAHCLRTIDGWISGEHLKGKTDDEIFAKFKYENNPDVIEISKELQISIRRGLDIADVLTPNNLASRGGSLEYLRLQLLQDLLQKIHNNPDLLKPKADDLEKYGSKISASSMLTC